MARPPVLTPQADDFPRWYQDVVAKAELADNGPARGTMVVRPYAYALWEHMQRQMDDLIKTTGAENLYFPTLIPESYIAREASHVEGFSHEFWTVTHGGGEELGEHMVLRPTSETIFGEYMAKWVQSYRDLPLLLNQWANIFRWELRPRLFLRTTEFLWQEGHTVHATREDAAQYASRIHLDVYRRFMEDHLAMPVLVGRKTAKERFAGAINTLTCEAMMLDGKALQMGTSHELGQNFARAFDITYSSESGAQELCWTTSWGTSTRMIGGLIMCHGDDAGLRLPPKIAPVQALVLLVRDEGGAGEAAASLREELLAAGVRVRTDERVDQSFGRRAVEWELKGVPVRVEVGPRELAEGNVGITRRDTGEKSLVPVADAAATVQRLLDEVQRGMFDEALARRESRTVDVTTIDDAADAAQTGFARIPWATLGEAGEEKLAGNAVTVRCLQRPDGTVPASDDEPDLVAVVARSY